MAKPDFETLACGLIGSYERSRQKHANTIILTIYGDTINPYGGSIWLGNLIQLVEPLGINHRLVRTSVYRLSEKGIIQSRQDGRRSHYYLTERGFRQYQSAEKRIYAASPPTWDGKWRMVMTALGNMNTKKREVVEKELLWLGFNRLSPGIFVNPTADTQAVARMLTDQKASKQVVTFYATNAMEQRLSLDQRLSQCIDIQAMEDAYQEFVDIYQPILQSTLTSSLDPKLCFLVRTLLINQYRIILLHEPELPVELLPQNALTLQARQVTRELYQRLCQLSDSYFLEVVQGSRKEKPALPQNYVDRFCDSAE